MVLPYNQLESHKQTCPFRRVTCEHCNTEVTISQLEVRKKFILVMRVKHGLIIGEIRVRFV